MPWPGAVPLAPKLSVPRSCCLITVGDAVAEIPGPDGIGAG